MRAPDFVTPFVITADAIIIAGVVAGLGLALSRARRAATETRRIVLAAFLILVLWFGIALLLGVGGAFRGVADRLPTIQFGILIPIAIGLLALWRSETLARILDDVPQHWLVGVQAYRTLGIVFILLWQAGQLPAHFALPAGWGDVAVGLLAPIVGLAHARQLRGADTAVLTWNLVGLLDLVVAVATGFLTSPSPFQMLALSEPNQLISAFPLVMVPVFAVPLSVLLHAASLMKLSRSHQAREARPIAAA